MKAKLDYDRAQNLFASHSMTKADYDAAKAQYDMTSAKVAAARSQVQMIQAKADSAKANIDVIQARSAGAQAVVQETKIPLQDTELQGRRSMGSCWKSRSRKGHWFLPVHKAFVVADTSSVKAVFGVADIAVAEMKLGQDLERRERNDARQGISADRSHPCFRLPIPRAESFNVEVTIANPEYLLRPNMIVSLQSGNSAGCGSAARRAVECGYESEE